MDINKKVILFLLIILGYSNVPAQHRWNVEISGGPSISYTNNQVNPYSPYFSELNKLGFSGGITSLYSLSPHWELAGEIGLASRAIGIKLVNIPLQNGYISKYVKYAEINSPTLSTGPRWSYRKKNRGIYFHPSFGILFNPDNLSFGQLNIDINQQVEQNDLTYQHMNEIGYFAKLDMGVRFFTKQNHYFLIGLRHVHGFNELENYYSENFSLQGEQYNFKTINKGSFSSLIVGYGIDITSLSLKRKNVTKLEDPGRTLIREIALSGGEYLMFSSGLRIKQTGQKNGKNSYSNVNGLISLVYGYRFNHFSAEAGVAGIFDNNYLQVDHPDKESLIFLSNPYSVWTIPVTMKYDFNLDPKGSYRVGGVFSMNFIIKNTSDKYLTEEFEGKFTTENTEINYQGNLTVNDIGQSKHLFFKAGFFVEALIGKSNFLNLQLSHNFASPILSSYNVEYMIDDSNSVNKNIESTVNGAVIELGLRKPLSTFKIKKKML